ncbi:hypothetical protein [Spirulina sp. 06S082]|uniref:hypothetical protein n=1 Tax=Spirulina sp. 06S082 TaxID=3110248 RepID=UPI002B20CEB5|nr:hypothetical protein [Spirulina sp. 06S082]MEA5470726.1 hypothetical protein [Spirulina sp. 06S082]
MNTNSFGRTIEMQEVGIAIAAIDLNPQMLNLDFLKFSGIIATDWELMRQPVLNASMAQLSFTNGVNVLAQPRNITFLEAMGDRKIEELQAPLAACRYVAKLPHADYQGVNINPKILIGFLETQDQDSARRFIVDRLLVPGGWQTMGQAPLKASLSLSYQLKRCPLTIAINEVKLQQPEGEAISALLFSGGFNYAIAPKYQEKKALYLQKRIETWPTDFEMFKEIVHKKFFEQDRSIFPNSSFL